ncbi:MAG: hypothetical protein HY661_07645 [Betaproteobacteria bacterium]|nr:hypothetical protein [Betaproteobacteria bacterium]
MNLQSINASASPEVQVNENFEALDWAAVYSKNALTSSGLTWGYLGGRWAGFAVTAGTLTLTDGVSPPATNYIVVARADGAASVSASATNWNDTANYARLYKVDVVSGLVSAVEDHRAGPGGIHAPAAGVATAGRHAVPISAAAMTPSATGGCAALATIASAANQPDIVSLDFDASTEEYAQFSIPMPKSWNLGTVTFKPIWSHAATTTNFIVIWGLQAVAVSNDDAIAAAYGTAQTSTDTGGTTDDLYQGSESSALTIAGTPAAEDVVFFRVFRKAADGGDTMAIDARLHAIVLYITTTADTDA